MQAARHVTGAIPLRIARRHTQICSRWLTRQSNVGLQCARPLHTSKLLRTALETQQQSSIEIDHSAHSSETLTKVSKLPVYCPGCGAPSQIVSATEAGFYNIKRHRLKKLFAPSDAASSADVAIEHAPICDRCNGLLNHSASTPILHPTVDSIHDIIDESPYQHNHIYHILDAADLPMSLIPSLQNDLRLPRLRTQNRRSKHVNFSRGREAEVSFIITRADLLAPDEEQVNVLMPYLREVIRDAMGHSGKNVRLGNLRCVSSVRGWWTKDVKEDIWSKGGGGWMVGKANVGKSRLLEVVFPKGRGVPPRTVEDADASDHDALSVVEGTADGQDQSDLDDALLPPARQEFAYPAMPISSQYPGTTVSPIRLPYGRGKGELIDLPGIQRSTLDPHVLTSARPALVMRKRVSAEQHSIKPGQSLLLGGGLVRITPTAPDVVILAYPFVPIDVHVTSTHKAEDVQSGLLKADIPSIITDEAKSKVKFATRAKLQWDVTRQRAGPLTSKTAVKLKPSQLPFVVWSTDLVIEGVGWVELVAQTRKRRSTEGSFGRGSQSIHSAGEMENPFPETATAEEREAEAKAMAALDNASLYPSVDVYTPEGGYVAVRRPMGAWALGGKKKKSAKGRPRKSLGS